MTPCCVTRVCRCSAGGKKVDMELVEEYLEHEKLPAELALVFQDNMYFDHSIPQRLTPHNDERMINFREGPVRSYKEQHPTSHQGHTDGP